MKIKALKTFLNENAKRYGIKDANVKLNKHGMIVEMSNENRIQFIHKFAESLKSKLAREGIKFKEIKEGEDSDRQIKKYTFKNANIVENKDGEIMILPFTNGYASFEDEEFFDKDSQDFIDNMTPEEYENYVLYSDIPNNYDDIYVLPDDKDSICFVVTCYDIPEEENDSETAYVGNLFRNIVSDDEEEFDDNMTVDQYVSDSYDTDDNDFNSRELEKDTRKILALRDSEKEEPEVVEDFEEVDMDFADDMDFTRLAKMDSEKKEKSDNILLGGLIESMNKIEEDDDLKDFEKFDGWDIIHKFAKEVAEKYKFTKDDFKEGYEAENLIDRVAEFVDNEVMVNMTDEKIEYLMNYFGADDENELSEKIEFGIIEDLIDWWNDGTYQDLKEKCGDKKDYRDIKESIRRNVRRKLAEKKENVKISKTESKKIQILNKFRKIVKESREKNTLDGYNVMQKIIRNIVKEYRFTDDDFEEETLTEIFENVKNYLDMKVTDEEYEALVEYFRYKPNIYTEELSDIAWELVDAIVEYWESGNYDKLMEKCGSKKIVKESNDDEIIEVDAPTFDMIYMPSLKPYASEKRIDWCDAMKNAKTLNVNNYSDWRLPTIRELKWMKENYPEKFDKFIFWSSDEDTDALKKTARAFEFDTGERPLLPKVEKANILFVRKNIDDSSMKEQRFFRRGRSEKRKFGKH